MDHLFSKSMNMLNALSSAVMCGRAWGGRVGLTLGKPSKPDRPCPETTRS